MDTPNAPLIIIGAGPAGLYAAVQLGMKGHRCHIQVGSAPRFTLLA